MQAEAKRRKQSVDHASLEPSARVKQLASFGTMVEVDPNVPPRRYNNNNRSDFAIDNVIDQQGSSLIHQNNVLVTYFKHYLNFNGSAYILYMYSAGCLQLHWVVPIKL